jgi:hypothetical protein
MENASTNAFPQDFRLLERPICAQTEHNEESQYTRGILSHARGRPDTYSSALALILDRRLAGRVRPMARAARATVRQMDRQ